MKKNMIVAMALALGTLSFGAVSASAANSCCDSGKCADKQAVQKLTQDTAATSKALKAKEMELRQLFAYDRVDVNRETELELEIKDLKSQIKRVSQEYGVSSCCNS
jgi:peptidoglycan hydrolase CwlO-like protein